MVDEPLRGNMSAEDADALTFIGTYYPFPGEPGWPTNPGPNPPPNYCEAPTQEQADECARKPPFPAPGAVQLFFSVPSTCTVTCPDGSVVSFTAPANLFYALTQSQADQLASQFACDAAALMCAEPRPKNTQQTCEIICPDSSTASYTVAAGSFTGSTQAEADGFAYAFACSIASLLCDGDPPPAIFSSGPQSCTNVCPDGSSITMSVPAGAALGLSQGDADSAAYALACALALIYCPVIPPLIGNTAQTCSLACEGVTISYTVPAGAFIALDQLTANILAFSYACSVLNLQCVTLEPPPPTSVGNTAQSCSVNCGSGTFTYTVSANQYRAENTLAANAIAYSAACAMANNHRTCLGDIATRVCQNSTYADAIGVTGDAPSAWSLSGSLPPGLTFLAGSIMGVATTLGTYSFTITARTPFGDAVRNYTIAVVGVVTSALASGDANTPYLESIVQSGFSNPLFSIVGGSLPPGLTLNPSTGVVSGTPTTSGGYSFVVQVAEGDFSCQKTLSITIASSVQAFWTLDSGDPATNTDSVNGQPILLLGFGTPPTPAAVPGVIGNCVQWFGQVGVTGPGITYQFDVSLAYAGNGWTFCFWVYKSDWFDSYTFTYRWDTSDDSYGFDWQNDIAFINVNSGGDAAPFASPTPNAWHFICFTYHTNGDLYGSVDGAALTLLGTGGVAPAQPGEASQIAFNSFVAEGGEYRIDLVALFPSAISNNQKNALWNGGLGQSYPPNLGPA